MVAKSKRKISETKQFDKFFSAALGIDPVLIQNKATIPDTIKLIRKVVSETLPQTKALAEYLKGNTTEATARNIWNFIYQHIAYEKDEPGVEQIRTPNRVWKDRFKGVDCDCYSTFISSILTNLRIQHSLRIAKYSSGYFQHIYVVVPINQDFYANRQKRRTYIVIDDVKDAFNDEHPYTEIQDTDIIDMDLQLLNGFAENESDTVFLGVPDFEVNGLGRVARKGGKGKKGKGSDAPATPVPPPAPVVVQPTALAPITTAVVPQMVVKPTGNCNANITHNKGVLKDGSTIERTTIPSVHGFEVYRNGKKWCQLVRFVVKNGVMRGHNTGGDVFLASSDKITKVQGVRITNKTYPLAGIETESYGSMFAVNGLGEITYNPNAMRFGMFIPGAEGAKLFNNYYGRISKPTLSGLGELAEILSDDTINTIEGIIAGLGDLGELHGFDGIEGIEGVFGDLELVSVDGADDNEQDVLFGPEDDNDWHIGVIDGLGRVRSARVRAKGRGKNVEAPATSAAIPPAAVVANAVPETKLLGWYIPLSTLRNLIAIRNKQIERLRANGHNINTDGSIPLNINGLDGFGELGDLGKLFQKIGQGIAKSIGKATPLLSVGANFIPGGGVAKMGLTNLNKFTGGKFTPSFLKPSAPGQSGVKLLSSLFKPKPKEVVSQPLPSQLAPSVANSNALQTIVLSQNQSPVNALAIYDEEQEVIQAYNKLAQHDLSGTSPSITDWAKRNPVLAVGSGAVILYGIWEAYHYFMQPKKKTAPSKENGKTPAKGKANTKKFQMVGFK